MISEEQIDALEKAAKDRDRIASATIIKLIAELRTLRKERDVYREALVKCYSELTDDDGDLDEAISVALEALDAGKKAGEE